jgi:hypothetical protein
LAQLCIEVRSLHLLDFQDPSKFVLPHWLQKSDALSQHSKPVPPAAMTQQASLPAKTLPVLAACSVMHRARWMY